MRTAVLLLCALTLIACDANDDDQTSSSGTAASSNGGTDAGTNTGTGSSDDGMCSYEDNVISNPEGGFQGDECTEDSDCRYGTCVSSPLVTGDQFKFCTKQCNCGVNSECSADGRVDGLDSTCLRFGVSSYPDEPMTAFCQRECSSVSDCKSFSEKYTDCRVIVGVTKGCTVSP